MLRIEEINQENRLNLISSLETDIIRHVFAVNDIQNDPQHTTTYAAFENGNLKGYILIYTATDVTSVILECEDNIAEQLFEHAPADNFIVHAPPNLLHTIVNRFPDAKHYVEDWMLVKNSEATYFKSELVRRLCTKEDASKLADLLLSRKDRPQNALSRYSDWISKMPIYGVFKNDQLVSYAGSFIQLPQVWFIGGVYTHLEHRNRGYATLATSAITEEALKKALTATLFVRSDNRSAMRAYEKIGYRKIGEKVWVDVGTGLKP
jgi:RimJ/RimL family protein N-acetyltransferase